MKRTIFLLFFLIFSVFTVFAGSSGVNEIDSLQWLTAHEIEIHSGANQTVYVPNPFDKGFNFVLKIIIGIGGGVTFLLMTAYDFVNAYRTHEEDPNSYSKVILKVVIKLVLLSSICLVGFGIVNGNAW